MSRRRSRRRHRRDFDPQATTASTERPTQIDIAQHPTEANPLTINPRTRKVLDSLASVPRLAAELGLRVAAHPDGQVEFLPGYPATLVFHAGGQLHGVFIFATNDEALRRQLRFDLDAHRDRPTELLWEEERLYDHLCRLPS
jgi:hypothetical protein